jgi:serine/threonine protein kinase
MDVISKKDKIKDYLILSLIDTVAELYSINYNSDKNVIKEHILSKLDEYDIIDTNSNHTNVLEIKDKIMSIITKDLPQNTIQRNISLFDNYKKCELIGSGGYANVYKVYNPLDDTNYAIKKIGIRNNFYPSLIEVRSMAKLNHINIIRYHTSWIESLNINKKIDKLNDKLLILDDNTQLMTLDNTQLVTLDNINLLELNDDSCSTDNSEYDENIYDKFIFIQMELCKENLKDYLKNNELSFNNKKQLCIQIVNGLKYIHDENVIHRDLKLMNIFIDFNNTVKIGDFGLATNIYDMNYEEVGTYGYIAPEILQGNKYDDKADLYSLGIIILEIFSKFKTNMEKILTIKDLKNGHNIYDNHQLNKLIFGLIKQNPNDRTPLDDVKILLSSL